MHQVLVGAADGTEVVIVAAVAQEIASTFCSNTGVPIVLANFRWRTCSNWRPGRPTDPEARSQGLAERGTEHDQALGVPGLSGLAGGQELEIAINVVFNGGTPKSASRRHRRSFFASGMQEPRDSGSSA